MKQERGYRELLGQILEVVLFSDGALLHESRQALDNDGRAIFLKLLLLNLVDLGAARGGGTLMMTVMPIEDMSQPLRSPNEKSPIDAPLLLLGAPMLALRARCPRVTALQIGEQGGDARTIEEGAMLIGRSIGSPVARIRERWSLRR